MLLILLYILYLFDFIEFFIHHHFQEWS